MNEKKKETLYTIVSVIALIIVIVGIVLLIALVLILAINVFIPKSNKNFEELRNASIKETSFYAQTKESLIYGTWKPLFEDVLSNYNNGVIYIHKQALKNKDKKHKRY